MTMGEIQTQVQKFWGKKKSFVLLQKWEFNLRLFKYMIKIVVFTKGIG
jgi:hypothetical protein